MWSVATARRLRSPLALALALVLVVGLLSASATPSRPIGLSASTCPPSGQPASGDADCAPRWGMAFSVSNSATPTAVHAQEQASGRPLDIVHTYHRFYDDFPTPSEQSIAASGHQLFINWEPTDAQGRPMSWASIAGGAQDAQLDLAAGRLKGLPPMLISFSHEPEYLFGQHGSAKDFVAAFRHVHDRLQRDGATNISWVWDVMGLADPVWRARYPSLWPGAAYVDWVAWDPYNWADCRAQPWQSFAQVVDPFYGWLEAHGYGAKPFMLAEYGSVEKSGDRTGKAAWFSGIPGALGALPNLKALVYFDVPAPPANCNWQLSTSPQATAAFDQLGRRIA